jgi:hypothetical protein
VYKGRGDLEMPATNDEARIVVFDVSPEEWAALTRRGQQNTRWPEQEAGAIVRRALQRDLRENKRESTATAV